MSFTIDQECATVTCDERLTVTDAGPTLAVMEAERQGWWVEDPVWQKGRVGCPEHGADCLRDWDPDKRFRVECEECGEVEWYGVETDAVSARAWHLSECAVPPEVSMKDTWEAVGDRGGQGDNQKE